MNRKFTLEEFTYWGTLLFATIVAGYLLVTLIESSSREESGYVQTHNIKRQARSVAVETSMGRITFLLARGQAPVSVNNFVSLAQSGFYDNTKFHRVLAGKLIQGGDPLSREEDRDLYGTGGPGYVFEDEIAPNSKMVRGMVAMANLGKPNTNGSQFFILVAEDAPLMDGRYTVIGSVIEGMDVVDRISKVAVDERDIPEMPVYVEEVIAE